jgi:hypothetical protein
MSTLEKTIDILNVLPENQIEIVYSYVQFIHSQQMELEQRGSEPVNDILDSLAGALPDSGKTLEQYREERIQERYEDCVQYTVAINNKIDCIITGNSKDYVNSSLPIMSPQEYLKT